MPKDPSLEALAALRIAVDLFNDHPGDDEESVEYHRKVATADMADNRYTGTMPTTGAGIAAALEWLFFTDEDEQLSGACSPRTQRFVRLLIDAARKLDARGWGRSTRQMPPDLPPNSTVCGGIERDKVQGASHNSPINPA